MNKKSKIILFVIIAVVLIVITIAGATIGIYFSNKNGFITTVVTGKKDDWVYNGSNEENNTFSSIFSGNKNIQSSSGLMDTFTNVSPINPNVGNASISSVQSESTIGYSVGGSKNISNFRENIKNGYFPISTDITYNGLFYDYYFNKILSL